MSLGQCIPGLIARGEVSAEQGAEMARLYDSLTAQYMREMGQDAAAALATEATLAQMDRALIRKRDLAGRKIQSQKRLTEQMDSYNGGRGEGPIDWRSGPAFLAGDGRASYSNVEGRWQAIRARAHDKIDTILAKFSTNVLGQVRNRADLDDLTSEAFGRASGNASAKEMFEAWSQVAEMLRTRFNAAGGNIGKIDNWGLPQTHNARKIREAGFAAWRSFLLDANGGKGRLNRLDMIDDRTGRPMSDDALDAALELMWQRIRSDNAIDREAGAELGRGRLADQRDDARFLKFASPEDWADYAADYGAGNAFDAMMSHIDSMSRDIAMLEILGPDPEGGIRFIQNMIMHSAQTDLSPGSKGTADARRAAKQMDRIYAELSGESRRPENEKLALRFSTIRSLQTAAKLGSATLSALTDTAFQFSTRRYNGLPVMGMLPGYAKMLASRENQQLAVRMGLIGQEWASRTSGQNRYLGEELTGEVSRRLAEGVLRISGLNHWTQAGRWAFGMEMIGHLTDERGKGFGELDPAFSRMLERYGIGAGEWDRIRSTPLVEDGGAKWLKPANVEDQALGDRLLEMIQRETDHAVPTADIRTRAMINAAAPRGTWFGEIVRSAALFKGFGISMMVMQGQRIMEQSLGNALKYTAGLIASTTLVGAMVLLSKDVLKGSDPREMFDEEGRIRWDFWGQATLQGGGLGIAGDFLRSSTSPMGGGLGATIAGPLVSDLDALARVPGEGWEGRALKLAKSELPGQSLWYGRLALDRIVADQIQQAADPNYERSWANMEKWQREQGTQRYWQSGETSPERAPDFANVGAPSSDIEVLTSFDRLREWAEE